MQLHKQYHKTYCGIDLFWCSSFCLYTCLTFSFFVFLFILGVSSQWTAGISDQGFTVFSSSTPADRNSSHALQCYQCSIRKHQYRYLIITLTWLVQDCVIIWLTMFLGVLQSFGYGSNILQIHIAKRFLVLSMEESD